MKKIVTLGLTLALGSLMFSACTPSASNSDSDAQEAGYTHLKKHMSLEEVHNKIKKAGEDAGWRMTEFKENSIIAEKIDGDETTSVTIIFSNDYFELSPENDDLKDAIEDALEKE